MNHGPMYFNPPFPKPARTVAPLLALALTAAASQAEPLYTAPFGEGGTWNLYQLSDRKVIWNDAKNLAENLKAPAGNPDTKGHLVTVSSMGENHFIRWMVDRETVWSGLTDDERFGGHEAGSHPLNGWKWITGEPLTFTNWKYAGPDEWTESGTGEDAVSIERYGRWGDAGTGVLGQETLPLRYVVEWETRSARPVPGAIPLVKTWPDGVVMPPPVVGKWTARWVSGFGVFDGHAERSKSITEASVMLTADAGRHVPISPGKRSVMVESQGAAAGQSPWLWLSTPDSARQGWLPSPPTGEDATNFPGLPQHSNYIGAVVGKIHVEKPGPYTFAVSAEDAFALRIGGLKWKSASGEGYIDPLDPLTFTQPYGMFSTKALAVMDLPAGDHVVEALWMVEGSGSEFHVLSAPGEYTVEGATTGWRPLGYEKSGAAIPTLGISPAGWTVDSVGKQEKDSRTAKKLTLQEGLVQLELDLNPIHATGLQSINFADAPETNPAHFPGASNFPNNPDGGKNDYWPFRARAKLIVPASGTYEIGVYATGLAAMRIKGASLTRFSQTAQGPNGLNRKGDSFDFAGRANTNCEPKIISEWDLQSGEHDIEVFFFKQNGPAALAVFASPAGPYPPGLLTVGGVKANDDVPGLPLAR